MRAARERREAGVFQWLVPPQAVRMALVFAWGCSFSMVAVHPASAEDARSADNALEEAVYRLRPLAEMRVKVEERMGHDQGQGFGARLAEAREKLDQGNEALQGGKFAEAKAFYEGALAAAGWLQTNASLRAEAREKRVSASELRRKAVDVDGPHLGLTDWRQGEAAREEAMAEYENGDFVASGAAWDAAAEAYGRSEAVARSVRVEQGLEEARGARRLGDWEEVTLSAGEVLGLDPDNAEARLLMGEAKVRGIAEDDDQPSAPDEPKRADGMMLPADAPSTPEPAPPYAASAWTPFQIGIAGTACELFPNECDVIGLRLNLVGSRNATVKGIDAGIASLGGVIQGIRFNLYNGSGYRFRGLEAGFINNDDSLSGLQLGFLNVANRDVSGIQIGFLNGVGHDVAGIQIGFLNGAGDMTGLQVGIFNNVSYLHGIQIGLFNIVDFGPLNFCPFLNMAF